MFSEAHGEWDIWVLEDLNIVLAKGKGGWNFEAALVYKEEFISAVMPLTDRQWAMFSFSDEWGLGVPELNDVIGELNVWMEANGRVAKVTMVSSMMVRNQIQTIADVANQMVHFVCSAEEAAEQLAKQGFSLPIETIKRFITSDYPERSSE